MYIRKSIHPIEQIIPLIKIGKKFDLDGDIITKSQRYELFLLKGCDCVSCGMKGTFFAKEKTPNVNKYHLNLYGINDNGMEVMMTKDHIHPKSFGGKDKIDNYQPLCYNCNQEKSNKILK